MKKIISHGILNKVSFFLILMFILVACRMAVSDNNSTSGTPLSPTTRDKTIAINFTKMLELRHVSKKKIDQTTSERGFDLFLKAIDPAKIYLTKADVDEFAAAYKTDMAALAKKGNLTPAFEIYNRLLQRIDERCELAHQLLDTPMDFSQDEYFQRDKKKLDFPASDQEVRDRFRQRIKFEILSLEADNREKEEKKAAEAKENSADNNGGTEDTANIGTENGTAAENGTRDDDPISKLHRRYTTLQKRMHQTNNDDILELYLTAIANAYDPHTTYMSPKTYENFIIQIGLNLEGIGATLQWDDGYTIVKRIVKGSPAEKQGELKVDDKIIGVGQGTDGPIDDVVDMKLTDVVDKIRGKGGTKVRLEVLPADGKGKKIITITREKIDLEDSAAHGRVFTVYRQEDGTSVFVDDPDSLTETPAGVMYKIGVIDLPSFYLDMKAKNQGDLNARSTVRDVKKILDDFNRQGVDTCVIDLRLNGGGSLPEAVELTGLFIETGSVVQVKPSEFGTKARSLDDPDPSIVWSGPLVVLTSKLSASASEIFAGAIRDYHRGLIIGDSTTHGKGSVQSMMEIADVLFGSLIKETPKLGAMKVTIQGFYSPAGISPQLQGVKSDIVLPALTDHMEDIAESDLDYPLTFEKISQAKYPIYNSLVTPDIIAELKKRSEARMTASEDFKKLNDKIQLYDEIKAKKVTPLNREKYFEELDKLDAEKEDEEKFEAIMAGESEITRDYYLDEVLNISVDYLNILQQKFSEQQAEK